MSASSSRSAEVDVVVLGGGAQGLIILRELLERGFSAALVTDGDLGDGQTLHSHGLLNSGYAQPDPVLRGSLVRDWLPFVREHRVAAYGARQTFLVAPDPVFEQFAAAWRAAGYPAHEATLDDLPPGFSEGVLQARDPPSRVVGVEEYAVPKRALVQALASGLHERVIKGAVAGVHCVNRRGERLADAVEVVDPTGRSVRLVAQAVVVAAGTGTKRLVAPLVSGADGAAQLDRITHERVHMICIRGPASVLPPVNLLSLVHGVALVSADVDAEHEQHATGEVTWYVTPQDLKWAHVEDVPNDADADTDVGTVARALRTVTALYPPLLHVAAEPGSPIRYGVYAGYKQNVGEQRAGSLCEPVVGVGNVILALPTILGAVWANARAAVEAVERVARCRSPSAPLPGGGEGVGVGRVRENRPGFEWMPWDRGEPVLER